MNGNPWGVIPTADERGAVHQDCQPSDQIVKWSEVRAGDKAIINGALCLVRLAYLHLTGEGERMHIVADGWGEGLLTPGDLTAVRRCACHKPEGEAVA